MLLLLVGCVTLVPNDSNLNGTACHFENFLTLLALQRNVCSALSAFLAETTAAAHSSVQCRAVVVVIIFSRTSATHTSSINCVLYTGAYK